MAARAGPSAPPKGRGRSSGKPATRRQGPAPRPPGQRAVQTAEKFWVDCVKEWYPERHCRTYFLPPIHINKVHYDVATIAGQSVLVPEAAPHTPHTDPAPLYPAQPRQVMGPLPPPTAHVWSPLPDTPATLPLYQDNDTRDDAATERVLRSLRALGEQQGEPMMVLSELQFHQYLDGDTDVLHRAACAQLPRPADLTQRSDRSGDFDILILHRSYGLIVCEMKSVGADPRQIPDVDRAVSSRVGKAVRQLDKAERVLAHLSSDVAPVRVTKTVLLPNITSAQLMQALSSNTQVSQALIGCVGGHDLSKAVGRCVCSDDLPTTCHLNAMASTAHLSRRARVILALQRRLPWLVSGGRVMAPFTRWWHRTVLHTGPDPHMTQHVYDRLLARFCGPATTVQVATSAAPRVHVPQLRTEGHAAAETGLRVSSLALYPDQVRVLNDPNSPCVYLHAPPGCGKTVMLVLKALQWLREGHHVHLMVLSESAFAVSTLMESQIRHTLGAAAPPDVGTLTRHVFGFAKPSADVINASPEEVSQAIRTLKSQRLCAGVSTLKAAHSQDGHVYVIIDEADADSGKQFGQFIQKLRAEVPAFSLWAAGVRLLQSLPQWLTVQTLSTPMRCPPAVMREVMQDQVLNGTNIPCYTSPACAAPTDGLAVRWLKHRGQASHSHGGQDNPADCAECGRRVAALLDDLEVGKGPHLQWRDVVIVCSYLDGILENIPDMVSSLQQCGVPVQAIDRYQPERDLEDLALGITNRVYVTDYSTLSGLERRVVVGMWGAGSNRLYGMSRCTSVLAWIDPPL